MRAALILLWLALTVAFVTLGVVTGRLMDVPEVARFTYYEDGSWINLDTGESGCYLGDLCDI